MNGPRIHIVCTANICRSPLAEGLLRHQLESAGHQQVRVDSSGTQARPGMAVDPHTIAALDALGIAAPPGSRPLSSAELGEADLVLTMERRHRRRVLEQWPHLLRRAFTLKEFVTLLDLAPLTIASGAPGSSSSQAIDRWRLATSELAQRRPLLVGQPHSDDIADPYGKGEAAFATTHLMIADQLERVVQFVAALSTDA